MNNPYSSSANVSGDAALPAESPAGPQSTHHPPAIWFFFWGEFAERSSYYGMRAILPLYLSAGLGLGDARGGAIFFWFKMGCYFLPLLGGFLADRWFGKYWTIVGFSVPYVLGHFILGIPHPVAVSIALLLLAGGSGVIKPNISTLLGQTYDQQRPGQVRLRSAAFMWFYFSINVGALISIYALPQLRDEYGYATAFQFPAWLMMAALAIFAIGRPYYAVETVRPLPATPAERSERWQALARLLGVFGLMLFFWIAYEQNDSLWVYFARDYVDLTLPALGWTVAPDQIQVVNPCCVLLLVPLLTGLFKIIDPDVRVFTATKKILVGFAMGAAASAVMSAAGFAAAGTEAKVSIAWPVVAYVVLTIGEVLLYGTGLELAYTVAPQNMKGFVTACFLVTIAVANFINAPLAQLYGGSLTAAATERGPLSPGAYFAMMALIAGAATVAFYFVGRSFDRASERSAAATGSAH